MSDQNRKDHFSSGFTALDEAGKTRIEKTLSQFSEPPSKEPASPCNQEAPPICKPADNALQLRETNEQ
jgi:hypothetical protein